MFSSIGNPHLYGSKIRGYFGLLTVIFWLLKLVRGLCKICAVLRCGEKTASSIEGIRRRTSFFVLKSPGPTQGGSGIFSKKKNSPPPNPFYTTPEEALFCKAKYWAL